MSAKSKGGDALDSVKTQQQAAAGRDGKAPGAGTHKAGPPEGADPAHDSPKRHGDKLEHARDAAAGRNKAK
jgi:hypothetical protein